MSILTTIGLIVLVFISVIMILLVLMQRSKDGGIGAAMGGGMAEATFGAETSNVLTKTTIRAAIIFFVLAFILYLAILPSKNQPNAAFKDVKTTPATAQQPTTNPVPAQSTPAK